MTKVIGRLTNFPLSVVVVGSYAFAMVNYISPINK